MLSLEVLDDDGMGNWAALIGAFDLAGDMGIRVVNASLGGEDAVPGIAAVANAHPNTLYVVAAGNDTRNLETATYSPCEAAAANVLCVGASDNRDVRAPQLRLHRGRPLRARRLRALDRPQRRLRV